MASRYVIAPSPLVKIFLEPWWDRLLDNPDLINDAKTPFEFDIPRGCAAFKMKFNKPVACTGRNDKDIDQLFFWLIGESTGAARETDLFGIVPYEPGVDLVERQEEISQLEDLVSEDPKIVAKARAAVLAIQEDTAKRLRGMKEQLLAQSEARIKRAMTVTHNNLTLQWQRNEEQKLGKYPPSITEMFGALVLKPKIDAANSKGAKVKQNINELMKNIAV